MFKIGFNGRGFRDMIMPFYRVLVLCHFFPLLNICFCLPHRRLRTPGLRNRQQCAYQVVQSLSILHFCLSNVSSLFIHSFTYRSPLLGDVNVGYANVCLSVKHVAYNTIPPGIGKLIKRVLYFHVRAVLHSFIIYSWAKLPNKSITNAVSCEKNPPQIFLQILTL